MRPFQVPRLPNEVRIQQENVHSFQTSGSNALSVLCESNQMREDTTFSLSSENKGNRLNARFFSINSDTPQSSLPHASPTLPISQSQPAANFTSFLLSLNLPDFLSVLQVLNFQPSDFRLSPKKQSQYSSHSDVQHPSSERGGLQPASSLAVMLQRTVSDSGKLPGSVFAVSGAKDESLLTGRIFAVGIDRIPFPVVALYRRSQGGCVRLSGFPISANVAWQHGRC